ncbi:hypothetical protein HAX54_022341, partial [Datura stramonium]|nr:hypothetical protein [Datura stramonium]
SQEDHRLRLLIKSELRGRNGRGQGRWFFKVLRWVQAMTLGRAIQIPIATMVRYYLGVLRGESLDSFRSSELK